MTNDDIWMRVLVLAVFNVPILVIAISLPFVSSLSQALKEKGVDGPIESTSYSRVTGLFGAVVLTSFFWAIGNVVIYKVFEPNADVEKLIDGVWKFFVLGAALFLPYAFNQLRAIMQMRVQAVPQAATAPTSVLAPGVVVPGAPGVTVLRSKA
jgi:hypothetical protein